TSTRPRAAAAPPRQWTTHATLLTHSWPRAPRERFKAVDVGGLVGFRTRLAQQRRHALHVLVSGEDAGLAVLQHGGPRLGHQQIELPLERRVVSHVHELSPDL